MSFLVGDTVKIEGLKSSGLNGLEGQITGQQDARYIVDVEVVGSKAIKGENLRLLSRPHPPAETSSGHQSKRVYALLLLLCAVGIMLYRSAVTKRTAQRRLSAGTSRGYVSEEEQKEALTSLARMGPSTPTPLSDEQIERIAMQRMAVTFHRRLFADNAAPHGQPFACARLSMGKMVRAAVESGNVKWQTFPGTDTPQSEYLTKCFQKMASMLKDLSTKHPETGLRVLLVHDADEYAATVTKEESLYLTDALDWIKKKLRAAPSLCGGSRTELLDSVQTSDAVFLSSKSDGCTVLERSLCARAAVAMTFGPPDPIASPSPAPGSQYQDCSALSFQLRKDIAKAAQEATKPPAKK